jgi:uncharacterized SAM-binding protein YcdF (DUF218 family)
MASKYTTDQPPRRAPAELPRLAWALGRGSRHLVTVVLLTSTVTLLAGHRTVLGAAGRFLVSTDTPEPADLIFMLAGHVYTRPAGVATLYHQGLAPLVVLVQERPGENSSLSTAPESLALIEAGVPGERIQVLPFRRGAKSTRDEARALAAFAWDKRPERVIVVTSSYHTRRARMLMLRELHGSGIRVQMVAAPEPLDSVQWWTSPGGRRQHLKEWIKLTRAAAAR